MLDTSHRMTAASLRALAADLADGTADYDAIDPGMLAALGCSHEMMCDENDRLQRELADVRSTVATMTLRAVLGKNAPAAAAGCIDVVAEDFEDEPTQTRNALDRLRSEGLL